MHGDKYSETERLTQNRQQQCAPMHAPVAQAKKQKQVAHADEFTAPFNQQCHQTGSAKLRFMLPFDPAAVVEIVQAAGVRALELHSEIKVETKSDQTLVTDADRTIESMLRSSLQEVAPGFSFLGEEMGLRGDADAPAWVIDPIDGTTNYVRGIPLWTISVGLVHRHQPIFGLIAVPPQGEIYMGSRGNGAWLLRAEEKVPIHCRDAAPLMQEDLLALNTTVDEVVDFSEVPCRQRNLGSLAYHLAALARGAFAASLSRHHKLYDIAAGISICKEAGCTVRYTDGSNWRAELRAPREQLPLLVAPPRTMDWLLERLKTRELATHAQD